MVRCLRRHPPPRAMIDRFGLRRCCAAVRSLGPPVRCSNPARNEVGGVLLCSQHAAGAAKERGRVTITLRIVPEAFEEEAAATLVLAVKRALPKLATGVGSGVLSNADGVVIGHWKVEAERIGKKRGSRI